MSSVEHNMYYIAGRIDAENAIAQLRDAIYTRTGVAIENYQRRTPHLTFLNRIRLPVHNESEVHEEIDRYNPSGIPIEITGICVWPSIDNPRYISLTVDAQIEHYQDTFEDVVNDSGGDILTEPPQPHITLFKCSNPHEVSKRTKDELRRLKEKDLSIETHIPYIDLLDDHPEPQERTTQKLPNEGKILLPISSD